MGRPSAQTIAVLPSAERVLELLRKAGSDGVRTDTLFYDERISDWPAQVAALRGMGHEIRELEERRGAPHPRRVSRLVLVRDAEEGAPRAGP